MKFKDDGEAIIPMKSKNPCMNHERAFCSCEKSICPCCGNVFWVHEDNVGYNNKLIRCWACTMYCRIIYEHADETSLIKHHEEDRDDPPPGR